uniref:GST N-terminal domain-containing protein n=1 Tax=Aegilops tauschii subsp. strangulata TaxID=200361 RepID=A0A453QHA8_AEGTS
SCPFCRKVREMVAVLDLDVLFYPCPQKGPTFRPKVLEMGGKKQFPYMVDPNTGVAMYESDDIIKYLADTYGDGTVPIMLSLGLFTTITAGLAMIWRVWKGSSYTVSKLPPQPIEIWAYEHERPLLNWSCHTCYTAVLVATPSDRKFSRNMAFSRRLILRILTRG